MKGGIDLADIKTREVNKGSIKTIDRASVMTKHIRQADMRIKNLAASEKMIQIILTTMHRIT